LRYFEFDIAQPRSDSKALFVGAESIEQIPKKRKRNGRKKVEICTPNNLAKRKSLCVSLILPLPELVLACAENENEREIMCRTTI